jgi:predicted nucleic acid-binding Zn ribbon protein
MSLADHEVVRTYSCHHCGEIRQYNQKVSDDWINECPACGRNEFYIKSGHLVLDVGVDSKKSRTVGMLASRNSEKMEKEGTLPESKWSKKKRVQSTNQAALKKLRSLGIDVK